jgi:hypothetical protein
MNRLFGPRDLSPSGLVLTLVVLTGFALHVGVGVGGALGVASSTTAVLSVMASWGLGTCRFARMTLASPPRLDSADA